MGMAVLPCSMKTLATMATGYPGLAELDALIPVLEPMPPATPFPGKKHLAVIASACRVGIADR
jgi:hypothetical protein